MFKLPPIIKNFSPKVEISINTAISLSLIFILLFDNSSFWSLLLQAIDISELRNLPLYIAIVAFIYTFLFVLVSLFSSRHLIKPLLVFLFILASVTGYYMDSFATVFDKSMIQNVARTDIHESTELLDLQLFFHVTLFGLLPGLLLIIVKLKKQSFKQELRSRLFMLAALISISSVTIYYSYKDISFVFREQRNISFMINPLFPMISTYKYMQDVLHTRPPYEAVFKDAKLESKGKPGQKTVLILVVGETARAQNFQLNGYKQKTNPYLTQQDIVNYSHVSACGTATAISVPCIFSWLGHDDFDNARAENSDNLLDALKTAGVDVLWRDNNSGCQRTCNNVPYEHVSHIDLQDYCKDGQCFDEILLHQLDDIVEQAADNIVIVLHQQGSHGPAYYKRYPQDFAKFLPECRTSAVQNCTNEEVTNAYDNTILYTDFFLNNVIEHLKKTPDDTAAAMIYISDHGESLGENGVYLHGLPYFMAPDEQTRVPMILWMSELFEQNKNIDSACMKRLADQPLSQDTISHSILGVMDISTQTYQPSLDIFAACRNQKLAVKSL